MELWIGRHGPDESGGPRHLDREKQLTARGVKHVAAVAARMKKDGQQPRAIFTSPFARAVQTADIYGRAFGVRVVLVPEIAPERIISHFICGLSPTSQSGYMVIGHHASLAKFLTDYADGAAPAVLACAEVRRYTLNTDTGCDVPISYQYKLCYRVTPADVGIPDMVTLRSILGL